MAVCICFLYSSTQDALQTLACPPDMHPAGTILEIYREARAQLSARPWRVDTLDALEAKWFSASARAEAEDAAPGRVPPSPFRRYPVYWTAHLYHLLPSGCLQVHFTACIRRGCAAATC